MKKILLLFISLTIFACQDHNELSVPGELEIQDFIWKGMNLYYLWQEDVLDLRDDRFDGQPQLNDFLSQFSEPTDLFHHLRTDGQTDRFSVIYSDYRVLEGVLSGVTKNNGVDFQLLYQPGSETEIFGWVRYILPGSDAVTKDIHRGDLFYGVNGTSLTIDNYQSLLSAESYTLNLADYDGGNITPNGQSVTLIKTVLGENPVYISDVIETGSHRIGYLMYNGFYPQYDSALNAAFGEFKSAQVTDLVLDLRYNSGGSIASATALASMITGQFTGQLFAKEQWNAKAQEYLEERNPGTLKNNFVSALSNGQSLQSLHLTRIFVLTTTSTASASELIINCLKPYIDVIQIGTTTIGKNVGSITLYDSPNYQKKQINPRHKYAMQPIVLKTVNKNGFGDYTNGLAPNHPQSENLENLGVLGDPNEPLLQTAINLITGSGRIQSQPRQIFNVLSDAKILRKQDVMYVDNHD